MPEVFLDGEFQASFAKLPSPFHLETSGHPACYDIQLLLAVDNLHPDPSSLVGGSLKCEIIAETDGPRSLRPQLWKNVEPARLRNVACRL
jgi:hypothetical protein